MRYHFGSVINLLLIEVSLDSKNEKLLVRYIVVSNSIPLEIIKCVGLFVLTKSIVYFSFKCLASQ